MDKEHCMRHVKDCICFSDWLLCWLQAEQSLWLAQTEKLHNSFNSFICLLWLVFLFKMALIKMH